MYGQVNTRRGDVALTLLDQTYVLSPSFHAIALLEEKFQRGIIDIARDYHNGKITKASEFLALVEAGLAGSGSAMPADLAERVVAQGLANLIEPLGRFLAHACGLR